MCGIYCHISGATHVDLGNYNSELLSRRGPDALKTHRVVVKSSSHTWNVTFTSSVLALRGEQVQEQPIVDQLSGSVLCWNGEAWLLSGIEISGNDTLLLSARLFEATGDLSQVEDHILKVVETIAGPYAFVFFDAITSKLYFGRDVLGRRSLLIQGDNLQQGELTISSVSASMGNESACEVATSLIYSIDLTQPRLNIESHARMVKQPRTNMLCPASDTVLGLTPSLETVSTLIKSLTESLRLRVQGIPTYMRQKENKNISKIAILFSGGLDCTLLTRLTHDILPHDQQIDLLNVAFENPRVIRARASDGSLSDRTGQDDPFESCPDRMTGRSSFKELTNCCPQRQWRFVAINVPYHEYIEHRSLVIQLMSPHNTEMDLSITSALYFAARGQGLATLSEFMSSNQPYTTTARVLLSGLGADEIFGGYARHAAAFARGGYAQLAEELELDFSRIGSRNLGRDDRVIAHWGRETRYPFLDERFVEFALGLPTWEKCGFRNERNIPKHFYPSPVPQKIEDLHPEKMLLRCAAWQLGLKIVAAEKKRAIQFGARTAKMHGGRVKGTDAVQKDDR